MEPTIYRYIWRHSWKQQLILLGLTVVSFPFLYYSLDLPKMIVNDALGRADQQHSIFSMPLDPVMYLLVLCGIFLVLVLINGAFKYVINVYAGVVSERMLRRMRYDLYSLVMRFPLPHLRRTSSGEIVQMINAEVEPLGGYVGDALSVPAFQGGTLLTILFFMFMQDPILGLAAIALYPLQMWLIPKLQKRVNALGKERVRQVRMNAQRIAETFGGVRDIRANDTTWYERAKFTADLGKVYNIRFRIYKLKFLIKFINNFLAQLAPFFFFSIGGYLVIQGDMSLGSLVAVLGAQKDLASPWRELLAYYQTAQDVKIKYEQVVGQFQPPGLVDAALQSVDDPPAVDFSRPLKVSGVRVVDDDGNAVVDGISFEQPLPAHVAIVGPAGGGREELSLVLAGLLAPTSGRVAIGDWDVARLPDSVIGRRMTYVGFPALVLAETIENNLLWGLRHRPVQQPARDAREEAAHRQRLAEARAAGNAPYDFEADWTDWAVLGATREEQRAAIVSALTVAGLDNDVYGMGLRSPIGETDDADLPDRLLEARLAMGRLLAADPRLARLVEPFDLERYNSNASVAENLLFGAPVGPELQTDRLASHPFVAQVLEEVGLREELPRIGLEVARTMVELFADLPPGHEYFQEFSFIRAEDLPTYKDIIGRADPARLGVLPPTELELLTALPFKLIQTRHRLGVFLPEHEAKVVRARKIFRDTLPEALRSSIELFDPERYTRAATVQDNVLFGKIAYGQAQAAPRIAETVRTLLDQLGLRERIIAVGLSYPCGVGGGRLSLVQRQKLAIARALLKRPDLIVLHEAVSPMDAAEQDQIVQRVRESMQGRSLFWSLLRPQLAAPFDTTLVIRQGRLVAKGPWAEVEGRAEGSEAQAA
jgi:ABC-type multidrug transport system fused ATPase/permease subunit